MNKNIIYLVVALTMINAQSVLTGQEKNTPKERLIRIETTLGNMVVKLYNETPLHRDNMLKLINEGFFNGQLFHRVIANFMIQGGDPHSVGAEKGQRLGSGSPGYTIEAEFHKHLIHKKGALAAARKGDQMNPEQRSSGSQFYVIQGRIFTPEELNLMSQRGMGPFSPEAAQIYTTLGGAPHLDGAYTVFGEIIEGLDVLDRIASAETDAYDRPLEDVVFTISVVR
jgi:peptidyl-prolyl cis-trans isomerase B (cyclophilin B)